MVRDDKRESAPRGRLLLVDDEPLILRSFGRALARAGFEVTVAEDGLAASALLAARDFDVVVSDIRMPRRSGLELLAELRARGPAAPPVVLVTATPTVADVEAAERLGAVCVLPKPIDHARLLEAIRSALRAQRASLPPS